MTAAPLPSVMAAVAVENESAAKADNPFTESIIVCQRSFTFSPTSIEVKPKSTLPVVTSPASYFSALASAVIVRVPPEIVAAPTLPTVMTAVFSWLL